MEATLWDIVFTFFDFSVTLVKPCRYILSASERVCNQN